MSPKHDHADHMFGVYLFYFFKLLVYDKNLIKYIITLLTGN